MINGTMGVGKTATSTELQKLLTKTVFLTSYAAPLMKTLFFVGASVLHSDNPIKVAEDLITEYHLETGEFDITKVNQELVDKVPSELQMGKVYQRLIIDTLEDDEDYVNGMIRIYNAPICEIIDDYNSSAYYEPSYVIVQAYNKNSFN